jgi:peptide/nickel transport system permease protein
VTAQTTPAVARRSRRIAAAAALSLLVLLAMFAIAAPLATPYGPEALDLANRRAAPSWSHPFGTDELGRDLLTRVLYGARISLAIGVLAALVAGAVGTLVGSLSGLGPRWLDDTLMRLTDTMLAVPRLPLLMIVSVILEPRVPGLIALVGLVGWMEVARLVRAELLSLRTRDFVFAARAIGARPVRLLQHHLLPMVVPTLSVAGTLSVGRSILLESALSFFGVGVQPPTPSWGNMLYQAQTTMSTEPWLALFPGLCIFATALAVNVLGEAWRAGAR